MTDPKTIDVNKLFQRCSIDCKSRISEPEFMARCHDRRLSIAEISAMKGYLKTRNLWEPLA
jgi:hypothetical protein